MVVGFHSVTLSDVIDYSTYSVFLVSYLSITDIGASLSDNLVKP